MCVGSLRNPQNVDAGLASTCCPFLGSGPREGRSQPRAPTGTGVEMTPRAERLRHVNSQSFIVKKLRLEHGTREIHNHGVFFQKRERKIHIYKNCKHVHLNTHTVVYATTYRGATQSGLQREVLSVRTFCSDMM